MRHSLLLTAQALGDVFLEKRPGGTVGKAIVVPEITEDLDEIELGGRVTELQLAVGE
jgi:hypothetical protein